MHFARHLVVSAVVLTSSSTLADAVFAESREPQAFAFSCHVPSWGKERCGDADRNVRVGRAKRLLVNVKTMPQNAKDPFCLTFFVYHAVSGDKLQEVPRICETDKPVTIWINPKEEAVDVFMKVSSNKVEAFDITGWYIVDHP
jgi:hypothetical protein